MPLYGDGFFLSEIMIKARIAIVSAGHSGSVPKGEPAKNQIKPVQAPNTLLQKAAAAWMRLQNTAMTRTTARTALT